MVVFVILIVLAAGCGVLLAALDRPQARDHRSLERYSVAFLAVGALACAAGVIQQVAG
jgi:hypothetical protein